VEGERLLERLEVCVGVLLNQRPESVQAVPLDGEGDPATVRCGLGRPVLRRSWSSRVMVETLTPYRAASCLRESSWRSTALRVRSSRSIDMGIIDQLRRNSSPPNRATYMRG
jgi:hypothetical protein